MDQLPRLGKRELICLLFFTFNYVVSVCRGFLFLWVLGMGYVILMWHSLSLPYNYFTIILPPIISMTPGNGFNRIFVNVRHPCKKYSFGFDSVLGWMPRLNLRIKVTARSKVQ